MDSEGLKGELVKELAKLRGIFRPARR